MVTDTGLRDTAYIVAKALKFLAKAIVLSSDGGTGKLEVLKKEE